VFADQDWNTDAADAKFLPTSSRRPSPQQSHFLCIPADDFKRAPHKRRYCFFSEQKRERKGRQPCKITDDIIKDFLIESNENLDRLDQELVQLESDPTSRELLDSILRTIHIIKGSYGFLGFSRLEKVAHAGENLLSKLREGQLTLNSEITSGLLALVDAVRRMLAEIQATEQDGDNDYSELLSQLKALQENNPPAE
jgi:HPt (histidine-containing phosphotransfer) domain-containing protein